MGRRIDPDVKKMTPAELRREVMRLRTAFRKELNHTGNHRCWATLMQAIDGKRVEPLTLSREEWLANCTQYYNRNQSRTRVSPHQLEVAKVLGPNLAFNWFEHEEEVRPAIKELDRRNAESMAQAHFIVVTNGK